MHELNQKYMYTTAAEKVEADRLIGLNKLHNTHTLGYIKKYLPKGKILELGCGSGLLAADMLTISPESYYVGIDRDLGQIEWSKMNLKKFPNTKIIQMDILDNLLALKKEGPFDLIYCRWVLVHLSKDRLVGILEDIFSMLSPNGIFLCDECDNRQVAFRPIEGRPSASHYEKATQDWLALSKNLMQLFGNDLELSSEKIVDILSKASHGIGRIRVEGHYQVIFHGYEQKRFITDGYRSAATPIYKASGTNVEQDIIPASEQCAKDENIEVAFLQQSVVSYSRIW